MYVAASMHIEISSGGGGGGGGGLELRIITPAAIQVEGSEFATISECHVSNTWSVTNASYSGRVNVSA